MTLDRIANVLHIRHCTSALSLCVCIVCNVYSQLQRRPQYSNNLNMHAHAIDAIRPVGTVNTNNRCEY